MNNFLSVKVRSTNQRMGYEAMVADRPPLAIDYIPPHGDLNGYLPMELILISLASCTGSGIAFLLRKRGKTVTSLTVEATGDRSDSHPTVFKSIVLDIAVESPDLEQEELQTVLKLAESSVCPVYIMLKAAVTISVNSRILQLPED